MTRKEILETALKCVNGDRDEQYGKPENSFNTIARLWNAYIDALAGDDGANIVFRDTDVAAMLALLKIARISSGVQKDDNWIDLAGYAACGGECGSQKPHVNKCVDCEFYTDEIGPADRIYGCMLHECAKKKNGT